jgi:uncharacterized cofD-like protein
MKDLPPGVSCKVTVIGGGTGSFHLLTGLKPHRHIWVQSIVTMMDSGGDSGRLRDEFGVLPPGDVRRCLVALSEESEILRDLFTFRFDSDPLAGRSFGNLLFLALTQILDSEEGAVDAMARILKIRGEVLPVTFDSSHLCAELEDGSVVVGEGNIDLPQHDTSIPIRRAYLDPPANANPKAIAAIGDCDYIVLAPGNLYTSTLPNLLVDGIAEAVATAKAPLIYVLNLMTVSGETQGYTASRHVQTIAEYAGRVPDAVIAHGSFSLPPRVAARYEEEAAAPVGVDLDALYDLGVKTVRTSDVMSTTSFVRHDPDRTGGVLLDLFKTL